MNACFARACVVVSVAVSFGSAVRAADFTRTPELPKAVERFGARAEISFKVVDADGGESVFLRLAADAVYVGRSGVRLEQRVVYELGKVGFHRSYLASLISIGTKAFGSFARFMILSAYSSL